MEAPTGLEPVYRDFAGRCLIQLDDGAIKKWLGQMDSNHRKCKSQSLVPYQLGDAPMYTARLPNFTNRAL